MPVLMWLSGCSKPALLWDGLVFHRDNSVASTPRQTLACCTVTTSASNIMKMANQTYGLGGCDCRSPRRQRWI